MGVSQVQLRVSRYTVQLSAERSPKIAEKKKTQNNRRDLFGARNRNRSVSRERGHCALVIVLWSRQILRLRNAIKKSVLRHQKLVVADVWKKDIWEFQARSGSSGSRRLFLHFLGKPAAQEMSGKTPRSPRPPSSRHPRSSDLLLN